MEISPPPPETPRKLQYIPETSTFDKYSLLSCFSDFYFFEYLLTLSGTFLILNSLSLGARGGPCLN